MLKPPARAPYAVPAAAYVQWSSWDLLLL